LLLLIWWLVRIGVLYILPFIFIQSHQSQLRKCVRGEYYWFCRVLWPQVRKRTIRSISWGKISDQLHILNFVNN